MAAMNKQQALASQQKKRNRAAQEFEASGGKIRSGSNGAEFYVDENGQQMPAGVVGNGDNSIANYIDEILGASGMTDAPAQDQGVQPRPRPIEGGGSGEGPGEAEGDGDQDDEKVVEDAVTAGIPLDQIAGGLLGAGAAVIATRLLAGRGKPKGGDPSSAGNASAKPASTDIVTMTDANGVPKGQALQDVIDGSFDEILGIEGPRKALPPPTNSDGTVADATMTQDAASPTPVDDPNLYRTGESPRTNVGQGYPEGTPVDETIQSVEGGPSAKLADPLEEGLANHIAEIFAKQGKFDPPAVSPATKGVNMAIMQRVRAILAGMRP